MPAPPLASQKMVLKITENTLRAPQSMKIIVNARVACNLPWKSLSQMPSYRLMSRVHPRRSPG